eukprot:TRINITY_DN18549_c0_g1_i1.p1 TRINITY_DN18549_c0_g1~~TRINITY_DN18549_c0_g1_i1.p1  ORF type:complete len:210 (+),score=68.16 TRINITY_DN18549_c0_g1_i1:72-632(+)
MPNSDLIDRIRVLEKERKELLELLKDAHSQLDRVKGVLVDYEQKIEKLEMDVQNQAANDPEVSSILSSHYGDEEELRKDKKEIGILIKKHSAMSQKIENALVQYDENDKTNVKNKKKTTKSNQQRTTNVEDDKDKIIKRLIEEKKALCLKLVRQTQKTKGLTLLNTELLHLSLQQNKIATACLSST